MTDQDDAGGTRRAQAVLRGDVEVVQRYGEAHPEDWGGLRFQNEPSVRLVAGFSQNLDGHREALIRLVEHPRRLMVKALPRSLAELEALREEIRATAPQGALLGTGPRWGRLYVHLRADQEDLAAQLSVRYGKALELEVGAFRYPMPEGLDVSAVRPPRYRPLGITGLELSLHLGPKTVRAGHQGRATVVVHNTGTGRVGPLYSGQPLVGALLDGHGRAVGGLGHVAIAGTGLVIDLQPDDRLSVPVLYGTASLRSDWGYLVPPGRYWLRAEVPVQSALPGTPRHALVVPAEELTVTKVGPYQRRRRDRARPTSRGRTPRWRSGATTPQAAEPSVPMYQPAKPTRVGSGFMGGRAAS